MNGKERQCKHEERMCAWRYLHADENTKKERREQGKKAIAGQNSKRKSGCVLLLAFLLGPPRFHARFHMAKVHPAVAHSTETFSRSASRMRLGKGAALNGADA